MTPTKFSFAPGMDLRIAFKGDQPWFIAADVCRALDLLPAPGTGSFVHHLAKLDADEVACMSDMQVEKGWVGMARAKLVNESGLYALIMRSRKPEAQRFRKWVTSEVLPAIRKTGSYSVPQKAQVFDKPAPAAAPASSAPADPLVASIAALVGRAVEAALGDAFKALEAPVRSPACHPSPPKLRSSRTGPCLRA